MAPCDVLIIGGGIIGISIAREIRRRAPGTGVIVLEKEPTSGLHASGRNGGFCMSWMSKAAGVLPLARAQEGVRLLRAFADGVRRI